MNRRFALWVVFAAALAAVAFGAYTAYKKWEESNKPITLVLGYGTGGSSDLVARTVAAEMSKLLGREIVVENVTGASGMNAAQKVIDGPADGSMIYLGGTDTVVIPMLNNKVKIDWEKNYQLLGRVSYVSMVFAVDAASPYNSLSDLLRDLRSGNKPFSYATPGNGTMQHLYGSLINKNGRVAMTHVPYKGGAQIATDLIERKVDGAILTTTTAMKFIKDGSMKVLSVGDSIRSPLLPNVKTLGEEEGFQSMAMPLWQAFFVKAGTPNATVDALQRAMISAVNNREVQTKLKEAGATPAPLNGRDMTNYVKQQALICKDVITSAKISVD